ncbi:MAG: hypothetical protein IPG90_04495 [Bacteroidetes bacterium]|nr:hypothetical protein [Bacteroidota bacterium]
MKLIKVKKNSLEPGQIKLSAQQIKLGNITFDTIQMKVLAKEVTLTGKVTVDQNLSDAISARVEGRIEKLLVKMWAITLVKDSCSMKSIARI